MSAPDFPAVVAAVSEALASSCGVPDGAAIAVACSGGADSVALVAALAATTARWPLVAVIFIDHGLRDVSAEAEAARDAAERAQVPFIKREIPPNSLRGNIQAAARTARYRTLLGAAPEGAFIATGHTADDQTETLLQRITRGTGLHGLSCIHPRQGRIIRPLLSVPRNVTRALGLPFADDPTNATPKFQRNRLRAQVLPALVAENPRIHEAVAEVRNAVDGSLQLIDYLLATHIQQTEAPGAAALPPLDAMPRSALAALLRHLVARVAPTAPPSGESLHALTDAIARKAPTFGVNLGNGWRATWRDRRLTISGDGDPRRHATLNGPDTVAIAGVTVAVAHIIAPPDDRCTVFDWPLEVTAASSDALSTFATDDAPVEIRDGKGDLIWPDRHDVSTVRQLAGPEGVFRVHIRRQPTLTVESNGHIRLSSDD